MNFRVTYNKAELRRVTTSFSLDEVNDAIKTGHTVLFENIKLNEKLFTHSYIFRDKENRLVTYGYSREYPRQYSEWVELPESEWDELLKVKEYARKRSLNHDWAAYILPLDPLQGEELYIEDLIEDVLVTEFWYRKIYAIDGIAVWNGKELDFKRELFDSSECRLVG